MLTSMGRTNSTSSNTAGRSNTSRSCTNLPGIRFTGRTVLAILTFSRTGCTILTSTTLAGLTGSALSSFSLMARLSLPSLTVLCGANTGGLTILARTSLTAAPNRTISRLLAHLLRGLIRILLNIVNRLTASRLNCSFHIAFFILTRRCIIQTGAIHATIRAINRTAIRTITASQRRHGITCFGGVSFIITFTIECGRCCIIIADIDISAAAIAAIASGRVAFFKARLSAVSNFSRSVSVSTVSNSALRITGFNRLTRTTVRLTIGAGRHFSTHSGAHTCTKTSRNTGRHTRRRSAFINTEHTRNHFSQTFIHGLQNLTAQTHQHKHEENQADCRNHLCNQNHRRTAKTCRQLTRQTGRSRNTGSARHKLANINTANRV